MSSILTRSAKISLQEGGSIWRMFLRNCNDGQPKNGKRLGGVRKPRGTCANENTGEERISETLPILALADHVLPHFEKLIRRDELVENVLRNVEPVNGRMALFVKKLNAPAQTDFSHLYNIGSLVTYTSWPVHSNDTPYVMLRAHNRLRRIGIEMKASDVVETQQPDFKPGERIPHVYSTVYTHAQNNTKFSAQNNASAIVQILPEQNDTFQRAPDLRTLCSQVLDLVRKLQPYFPYNSLKNRLNSRSLSPLLLSFCPNDFSVLSEPARLQELLDENDTSLRLRKTLKILKEELNFFVLAQQLNRQASEGEIREAHVFNLLRLKNIIDSSINNLNQPQGVKNENPRASAFFTSGTRQDSAFERKIKERLKHLVIPEAVEAVIKEELTRLAHIDKVSAEYGVVQSYLDHLTLVPWGVYCSEKSDVKKESDKKSEENFSKNFSENGKDGGKSAQNLKENLNENLDKNAENNDIYSDKFLDENINQFSDLDIDKNYNKNAQASKNSKLNNARFILDEDHYGLDDVKNTILEHLAVGARSERVRGRIICLVGPPGVGKTSVAKSIARALDRTYVRVSVGGIDDAAEIKGHRRTYIGALPGKIIKGLELAKCMDPVFCVDEVDKLVRGHRGDPGGALLEAFDPEQNSSFLDHYLDVPVDLSKILFVCTANSTGTIPAPLLDRMDVIKVTGYTSEEKLAIINQHLIPSIAKEFNISNLLGSRIIIDPEVIQRLSDEYFLEPGVRNARKCLEKIIRKAVVKLDLDSQDKIIINMENISDFAGYPDMPIRRPVENGVIGVVTGLSAVDSYVTGFTMDIEVDFVPHASKTNNDCLATGLAGKALSESSLVAVAVAKKYLAQLDPDNKSLQENLVRVHFLEGGIQKDGPSAGVGIFCAVMSQALGIPVSRNLAMTGELTLKGNVMAVGGIREKVTAAIRSGIGTVILPTENVPKFKELVQPIRDKVNPVFVSDIHQLMRAVFPTAFPESSPDAQKDQDISVPLLSVDSQTAE